MTKLETLKKNIKLAKPKTTHKNCFIFEINYDENDGDGRTIYEEVEGSELPILMAVATVIMNEFKRIESKDLPYALRRFVLSFPLHGSDGWGECCHSHSISITQYDANGVPKDVILRNNLGIFDDADKHDVVISKLMKFLNLEELGDEYIEDLPWEFYLEKEYEEVFLK